MPDVLVNAPVRCRHRYVGAVDVMPFDGTGASANALHDWLGSEVVRGYDPEDRRLVLMVDDVEIVVPSGFSLIRLLSSGYVIVAAQPGLQRLFEARPAEAHSGA